MLAEGAGPPVDAPGLDVPDDHPAAQLVAAGSHPDLMRLERLAKDGGTELARTHQRRPGARPAAAVRDHRLDVALAGGGDRFDRRSRAQRPPTPCSRISRSRRRTPSSCWSAMRPSGCCRRSARAAACCAFSPLDDDAMTSALRAALPDADARARSRRWSASGRARPAARIAWRGLDIAALDRAMDALVRDGDPTNARRAALAAEPRAQIGPAALRGLPRPRARRASPRRRKARSGAALAEALRLWERAAALAGERAAPLARSAERRSSSWPACSRRWRRRRTDAAWLRPRRAG